MSVLTLIFLTAVFTVNAQRDELGIRQIGGMTIAETNVIYWETLPITNGIRYGCSKPVEDTRYFMDCQTEGLDNEMSRATCQCTSGSGNFYITCYKDGKWYPPIASSCDVSSSMSSTMSSPATESATRTSGASATTFSVAILATSLLAVFL